MNEEEVTKLDDLTEFQKLENPIELTLEQYECPSCKIKVYVNKEDVKEIDKELDCSFCNVHGLKNTRVFKLMINEIFEK